jgi:hypothetical protein
LQRRRARLRLCAAGDTSSLRFSALGLAALLYVCVCACVCVHVCVCMCVCVCVLTLLLAYFIYGFTLLLTVLVTLLLTLLLTVLLTLLKPYFALPTHARPSTLGLTASQPPPPHTHMHLLNTRSGGLWLISLPNATRL